MSHGYEIEIKVRGGQGEADGVQHVELLDAPHADTPMKAAEVARNRLVTGYMGGDGKFMPCRDQS